MRSSKEMIAAAQKQGIIQPRLTRFAVNQEIILVLCHLRTRSYTRAGSNWLAQTMLYRSHSRCRTQPGNKSWTQMAAGLWCRSRKQLKPVSKFWNGRFRTALSVCLSFPLPELGMRPRSGGATLGSQLSGRPWRAYQFCSVAAQSPGNMQPHQGTFAIKPFVVEGDTKVRPSWRPTRWKWSKPAPAATEKATSGLWQDRNSHQIQQKNSYTAQDYLIWLKKIYINFLRDWIGIHITSSKLEVVPSEHPHWSYLKESPK